MDAHPQTYGSSQWYLTSAYVPDGSLYRSYPSPAPSDPSPLPRTQQMLAEYNSISESYQPQLRPNAGPTLPKLRRSTNGRAAPHASYSDLNTSGLHLDRPKDPMLPPTPVSMFSPYHISGRPRASSNADHQRPRAPSPAHSSGSHSSHGFEPPPPARTGPVRTRANHRKQRLRDSDRKMICQYQQDHPNARQEDIANEFGVERSTISKILKAKERWLNINEDDESNEQSSKHRPSKFPEVEWEMLKSLQEWSDNGTNITDNLIRDRALEIAKGFRISSDRFKGSSGWIENFKHRHEIRRGEWLKAEKRASNSESTAVESPSRSTLTYDRPPPTPSTNASSSSQLPQVRDDVVPRSDNQVTNQHWSPAQDHPPQQSSLALDSSMHQDPPITSLHMQQQQHPTPQDTAIQHSPQPQPVPDYSAYYGQGMYIPPGGYKGPADVENPTLAEAELAINTVITFIAKCQDKDLLKTEEKQMLHNVKCALFQYASGIPFHRSYDRRS